VTQAQEIINEIFQNENATLKEIFLNQITKLAIANEVSGKQVIEKRIYSIDEAQEHIQTKISEYLAKIRSTLETLEERKAFRELKHEIWRIFESEVPARLHEYVQKNYSVER